MIVGKVNSLGEAKIAVAIIDSAGRQTTIEALIDTGFDGALTLPANVVTELNLPWKRRGRAQLADGSEVLCDVHEAIAIWHDRQHRITVDVAETTPLLGMALLWNSQLKIEAIDGGRVEIRPLP